MADRQRVAAGARINGQMKGSATEQLKQAEAARRAQKGSK